MFFNLASSSASLLFPPLLIVLALLFIFLPAAFRILREYERAVVFRLGRFQTVKGPGLIFLIPFVDQMERVDLRTITLDVPVQDIITRDNVSVKVNAVAYYRVIDPLKAIVEIENYQFGTSQMSQTTLRDVLGTVELDELLSDRDKINGRLQTILDQHTGPWGIKVTAVELKHVDLPTEMIRAMARQAEAERERRAKVISAEGEFQASARLSEAAEVLDRNPSSIQLRYLQTLMEISNNGRSTFTVFPLPIDLIRPLIRAFDKKEQE